MFARAHTTALRITGDRSIAEDLAAEACARALVHWRSLRDSETKDRWVVRVTSNLAIDALRKKQPAFETPSVPSPEDLAMLRVVVADAVRTLPRGQRQALVLRHLVGLSELETADVMGVSPGSVKTHLHRAISALREHGAFKEDPLGSA